MRGREPALRNLKADVFHGFLEQFTVLGLLDGRKLGADQLDLELLEHAGLGKRHRRVQRGLAAHGRQQRIRPFPLDDLRDDGGRDRLDVGAVRHLRVGHDRGRVRVHQHDLVALFLERLAGLHARVVELAGLADHDRPRADDQDLFDVCSFSACNLPSKIKFETFATEAQRLAGNQTEIDHVILCVSVSLWQTFDFLLEVLHPAVLQSVLHP